MKYQWNFINLDISPFLFPLYSIHLFSLHIRCFFLTIELIESYYLLSLMKYLLQTVM